MWLAKKENWISTKENNIGMPDIYTAFLEKIERVMQYNST